VTGAGGTTRMTGELLEMTDPATNASSNTAWTNKENFTQSESVVPWVEFYDPPKACDGPCIVKIQVSCASNNNSVIATFDAFIVDN